MTLEQLMHDPRATAQQILDAADDAKEVADAAALVLAEIDRVSDEAQRVLDEHQAMLAKSGALVGTPESADDLADLKATGERAKAAVVAAQTAWQRYQPWKEALDRIDAALEHMRIVESN